MSLMIKLPQLTAVRRSQPRADAMLRFDELARAALETYRSNYNMMPVANLDEFRWFFSEANFKYLYDETTRRAKGHIPEIGELFDKMMWAFTTIGPRQDQMDERRELFGDDITISYVKEMNALVLERLVAEVVSANMQADTYYKYALQGPIDWVDDSWSVDSRTRLTNSRVDMTYLLP